MTAITSENPGAFTNTSDNWIANTILVASTAITTKARATQVAAETLTQVNPNARISQVAVEVLSSNASSVRPRRLVFAIT